MRRITVLILLLLMISLFNIRVHALPTTLLPFKVLYLDTTKTVGILDWEGSDTISYSYTTEGTATSGGFTTTTDYAFSGSYSYYWYAETSDTDESLTVTFTFTPRLHEIRLKWRTTDVNEANEIVIVTVYCDNEEVYSEETNGVNYESLWVKIDLDNSFVGYKEMKVEVQFTGVSSYRKCYIYIDAGKRFGTRLSEENLQVEYWVERIGIDTYRVHYILDESQFVTTWGVAYIEGSYYIEEGNGGRYGGLDFGEGDYIKIPDSSSLDEAFGTLTWTKEALVYFRSIEEYGVLPDKMEGGYWSNSLGGIWSNIDGKLYVVIGSGESGNPPNGYVKIGLTVNLNEWVFITGIADGNYLYGYVNGELQGSKTITDYIKNNLAPNDAPVMIGRRTELKNNDYIDGIVAFITAYKRTLPSDEIYDNYINEEPTNTTGLVLYLAPWSIDPILGWWYDVSGYSNHGKIYYAQVSSEKAKGLTIVPGNDAYPCNEWKFYRDYTESQYPHEHYFIILRFDNSTLCNSTLQIDYGSGEDEVNNYLWYKEKSSITAEFYTVKNGSDWYRHFRVHPSITAYVPNPTESYSYITFNIHDYTSSFENSSLLVYDTKSRLIQEELISSTYQAVCYLKPYESYLLVIRKGTEERAIGWIVIDSATKDLYIGVLPPTYTSLFKDVKYSVEDDESNTQMTITINASSSFNYKVEIYRNGTLEFSKEGEGVTAVSITYDYTETGFREVHISITDPSTGDSMTRIHYTGRAIEQMPSPPDRITLITQLLNNTVMNQLQQYASIGLENIIAYLLAISVFLLLATKYSLGSGMIGSGIAIIFVKAYLGSVTAFPDLMISTIIIFGGIYELTKKR